MPTNEPPAQTGTPTRQRPRRDHRGASADPLLTRKANGGSCVTAAESEGRPRPTDVHRTAKPAASEASVSIDEPTAAEARAAFELEFAAFVDDLEAHAEGRRHQQHRRRLRPHRDHRAGAGR